MQGGRPEPPRAPPPPAGRRLARALGGLAAFVVALGLALSLGAPLVLRGRVLRWIVGRATASLCGSFTVEGGHFGWTLVPDVVLGRAVTVEVDGLRVAAPDGTEVLAAERLGARVTVARGPWRVVVDEAVATNGRWRLSMAGAAGGGFLDAFRALPAGGARAACFAPPPDRRAAGGKARRGVKADATGTRGTTGPLTISDLRLDGVDVDLDFPAWGLTLPAVHATGMLAVGAPGSAGLLFEARDAEARGGVLRVGSAGGHRTTRARFDDVVIGHVGITAERPTDLVLTVRRARTRGATLTGTAAFENILLLPGATLATAPPPAFALDARWEDAADALDHLEAEWLPRGATLEGVGLGGLITARLRGPFQALSGALTAEGPRAHIRATLEQGTRATVDVRATRIDVTPLLDASSRPLLGGVVRGELRASVALGARLADVEAAIDAAEISLARTGAGPRTVTFYVGPRDEAPVSTRDSLTLDLSRARFRGRTLALEGARASWAGVSARGALALELPTPAVPPAAATSPAAARLDATIAVTVTSLERFVPPATAAAHGSATVTIAGPLDHVRARVAFGRETRATIVGQTFRAPRAVDVAVDDGRALTLSPFVLTRVGGGSLEAHGRAEAGGALAGALRVDGFPLAQIPGLRGTRAPVALAPGRSLADALAGTLSARLAVAGTPEQPTLGGTIAVADVAFAGRTVGDGHFDVRARPDAVSVNGALGPSLSLEATVTRWRDGLAVDAKVSPRALALGPWLPPPFAGLPLAATGEARLALAPRAPLTVRGDLRVEGAGDDVALAGQLAGRRGAGTLRGRVELASARALWSPTLADADGALDVDLAASTSANGGPTLTGTVAIARALRLRPAMRRHARDSRDEPVERAGRAAKVDPLAEIGDIGVEAGGRLEIAGPRLHTPGLDVTAAGVRAHVSGDVDVDARAPLRSRLALAATARLDAATLARRVPLLEWATGAIEIDARATGEARDPAVDGRARFERLALRAAAAGWPTLTVDGTIEASGHTLHTRDLRVETGPAGVVTIGTPAAPASVQLATLDPLVVGALDVPVTGQGLQIGDARAALHIRDLDFRLRLVGDPATALALTGDVGVAGARLDAKRGAPAASGASRPWYTSLPPRLTLDLTVHGPANALVVAVPGPDVTVGFDCHVRASARGAALTGHLRGGTAYSRLALSVYDWLEPQDIRHCRVFKE
jgi:hypothetical protein